MYIVCFISLRYPQARSSCHLSISLWGGGGCKNLFTGYMVTGISYTHQLGDMPVFYNPLNTEEES